MNQQDSGIGYIDGEEVMDEQTMLQRQREMIDRTQGEVVSMRNKWVQHRATSGVETRMRRANELYHGGESEAKSQLEDILRNGPSNPASKNVAVRSRVVVNIVQPKTEQAVARMCEILFPVDDRNWGIKPTPVPEVAKAMGDKRMTVDPVTMQPTGLTADEEAKALVEVAKKAAEGMQDAIDDSLTECKYNSESRKVIENGTRLGTGVMYGPFPSVKTTKIWRHAQGQRSVLQITQEIVPKSESLDPWNVYFDPSCGNDHQRGAGFFIKRDVNRKELRALRGQPGYDTESINAVLQSAPLRSRVTEGRVLSTTVGYEESYELWQYHGEIEPQDMCTLSLRTTRPEGQEERMMDDVSFGVLIMVNDKVIGAMESWVADKTLPVDVWNYRKSDDSPYGFGLPDALEHQQGVINAAWRQVMDNARVSMGGQIIMRKGTVIPANSSYEITPNKIWYAKDDTIDVTKAFHVAEFQSHLQELLAIAQAAMTFADTESNMPQLMGGEQGSAPETVGGTILLFNQANGVLRQRVKLYDDTITSPHITRYFDWNMEHNPNEDIKGDSEVDARGSTALIEKDIANQALLALANVTSNPRYAPLMNVYEELSAILKAFKVDPKTLMKPIEQVQEEEKAMQEAGAPADPRIEAANIMAAQKDKELADRAQQREFEAQRNAEEFRLKEQTLEYNKMREQSESDIALRDAELTREVTIAKMLQDGDLSREEREAKDRLELIKIDNERQLFSAEAYIKNKFQGSGISDH